MRSGPWIACALFGCALALGCPSGKRNGTPPGEQRCQAKEARVAELLRAEAASRQPNPSTEPRAQALMEQAIADDVDMVLRDCRADPGRVLPCVESAVSASQMLRDCLIPIDDRGAVEGRAFGDKSGPFSNE